MKKFFVFTFFCFISLFISGCSDSPKDVVKKCMNAEQKYRLLYVIPNISTGKLFRESNFIPSYALEEAVVLKEGSRCIVFLDEHFIFGLGKYDGCWKIDCFYKL